VSQKSQETTIDGLRFRVAQMPGKAAYFLSNDVIQLLAPGLHALAKVRPGTKLGDIPVSDFAPALASMLPMLTHERQEYLTNQLLSSAVVIRNGQQEPVLDVFDEIFMGRVLAAYQLMAFALKVNFGSFGAALGSLGIGRQTPTPSHFETLATSAGPPSG
jgi:hypothetical protein